MARAAAVGHPCGGTQRGTVAATGRLDAGTAAAGLSDRRHADEPESRLAGRVACRTGDLSERGIWPSLNATLIWALAAVDPAKAWDEWKKNSFAVHAEVYPEIWYNTWSGGDTLNSTLSKTPGHTVNSGILRFTDFPVMNLHSHACPLYAATKLMGIAFNRTGVEIAPVLPAEEYRLESPLVGVRQTKAGYEGWYEPSVAGEWTVTVRLPEAETNGSPRRKLTGVVTTSRALPMVRSRCRDPALPGSRCVGQSGSVKNLRELEFECGHGTRREAPRRVLKRPLARTKHVRLILVDVAPPVFGRDLEHAPARGSWKPGLDRAGVFKICDVQI